MAPAVLGGVLGMVLAWWGTRALIHFAPPNLPRAGDVHVDYAVLGFAMGISMLSALVFGVLPALQASRAEFSSRGVLRGGSHALRNSLVVAEIALSFVLATGAGLFFRSFLALNAVDMGFRADNTLVMYAHAPAKSLQRACRCGAIFVDQCFCRRSRACSWRAVDGCCDGIARSGRYGSNGSYAVVGKHVFGEGQKMPQSNWSLSSPNYFATLGVPLLRGRDFTVCGDRYDAPGVIIVSDSVVRARRFPVAAKIRSGGRLSAVSTSRR